MNTSENKLVTASQIAANKEETIRKAIYHVFGEQWDESEIVKRCSIEAYQYGSEFFFIDGKPVLEFCPIETNTEISVNNYSVTCRFQQEIKEFF